MIAQDHLQVYTLTLTTQGPLHIGNGLKTPRKEYIFNSRKETVSFLNEQAFFDLLIAHGLVELYEGFCLRRGGDLYRFLLDDCGLTWAQVAPAIRYQVSADNALDAEHALKDICRFMRDARGSAYVPGSSVKGALRTALLYQRIAQDQTQDRQPARSGIPEEQYFHTLHLNDRRPEDAVNSLMRGVQISDSEPVSDQTMMLALKLDGFIGGGTKPLPVCRECVAPGTTIRFRLTLDQSILRESITAQSILEAISAFAAYNAQVIESRFARPAGFSAPAGDGILYMGGGAGFFGKSLIYPYLGETRGLDWTAAYLTGAFKNHHHDKDRSLGISPRTLKYAKYRQRLYAVGACRVEIA